MLVFLAANFRFQHPLEIIVSVNVCSYVVLHSFSIKIILTSLCSPSLETAFSSSKIITIYTQINCGIVKLIAGFICKVVLTNLIAMLGSYKNTHSGFAELGLPCMSIHH